MQVNIVIGHRAAFRRRDGDFGPLSVDREARYRDGGSRIAGSIRDRHGTIGVSAVSEG